jgi:hypothetical protein
VRSRPAPHRRTVYQLDELDDALREHGWPPGYADPQEEFDVYVEAQVWDDAPLRECVGQPAE